MRIPTLRQLQYLTAVVEEKHFGKAAEKCFVTQSTLSAGIQDLEDLLETALLERTNRKVLTTPMGEEIAHRARQILSLTDDLVDLAHSANNPLAGRIRIGVIPTISPFCRNWKYCWSKISLSDCWIKLKRAPLMSVFWPFHLTPAI